MTKVWVRRLAQYKGTTLCEVRTMNGFWYEFSRQWNIRHRFELHEWGLAKATYKRQLDIYARMSIRRKWLKPGETLPPLPPIESEVYS